MDLLVKMLSCSRRWFRWTIPFVLVLAARLPLHGYAPTLIFGVYGEGLLTAGGQTDENRDDFLGSLKVSAGGLIGYFHDWSIAAEGGVRWSDANRWTASLQFEEGSESYLLLPRPGRY